MYDAELFEVRAPSESTETILVRVRLLLADSQEHFAKVYL